MNKILFFYLILMFIESHKNSINYFLNNRITNKNNKLHTIQLYSLKQNKINLNNKQNNKHNNEYPSTKTQNNEIKLPMLIKDYDIYRIYENKTRIKSQKKFKQIMLKKFNNKNDILINGNSIDKINATNYIMKNNFVNKNNKIYMHNLIQKFLFRDKFINQRIKNLEEKNDYSYNINTNYKKKLNKKIKMPSFHNEELISFLTTENE